MAKRIISMAELLYRVAHFIFKKKVKTGGRDTDNLWSACGKVMDDSRADIVVAGNMMHPATSEGEFCDRWGKCLGGLYRIPGETDGDYSARLGNAGAFWESVGTTGFFEGWLLQIGWTVQVAFESTYLRRLAILDTTGLTDCMQLVHDLYKFRAAHLQYRIALYGDLAYAGIDHEYGNGDGYDTRPAMDYFGDFS